MRHIPLLFPPSCAVSDAAAPASRLGRITEALWRRPKAHRSAHPTHSIAAIGQRAEELLRGHEHTSTFGKDGPCRRYVDWGAKVERLLGKRGLVGRGKVAAADARWIALQEMVEAVVDGIYDAPDLLLCDREDCELCTRYRRPTIDHIRNNRPRIYGASPKEVTRRSSQNAHDAGYWVSHIEVMCETQ